MLLLMSVSWLCHKYYVDGANACKVVCWLGSDCQLSHLRGSTVAACLGPSPHITEQQCRVRHSRHPGFLEQCNAEIMNKVILAKPDTTITLLIFKPISKKSVY